MVHSRTSAGSLSSSPCTNERYQKSDSSAPRGRGGSGSQTYRRRESESSSSSTRVPLLNSSAPVHAAHYRDPTFQATDTSLLIAATSLRQSIPPELECNGFSDGIVEILPTSFPSQVPRGPCVQQPTTTVSLGGSYSSHHRTPRQNLQQMRVGGGGIGNASDETEIPSLSSSACGSHPNGSLRRSGGVKGGEVAARASHAYAAGGNPSYTAGQPPNISSQNILDLFARAKVVPLPCGGGSTSAASPYLPHPHSHSLAQQQLLPKRNHPNHPKPTSFARTAASRMHQRASIATIDELDATAINAAGGAAPTAALPPLAVVPSPDSDGVIAAWCDTEVSNIAPLVALACRCIVMESNHSRIVTAASSSASPSTLHCHDAGCSACCSGGNNAATTTAHATQHATPSFAAGTSYPKVAAAASTSSFDRVASMSPASSSSPLGQQHSRPRLLTGLSSQLHPGSAGPPKHAPPSLSGHESPGSHQQNHGGSSASRRELHKFLNLESPAGSPCHPQQPQQQRHATPYMEANMEMENVALVQQFLETIFNTVRFANSGPMIVIASLIYLHRVSRKSPCQRHAVTTKNWLQLVVVSMMVATKVYTEDEHRHVNRKYAEASNIALSTMRRLEIEFLYLMDFSLLLEEEEIAFWCDWLLRVAKGVDARVTPVQRFLLGGGEERVLSMMSPFAGDLESPQAYSPEASLTSSIPPLPRAPIAASSQSVHHQHPAVRQGTPTMPLSGSASLCSPNNVGVPMFPSHRTHRSPSSLVTATAYRSPQQQPLQCTDGAPLLPSSIGSKDCCAPLRLFSVIFDPTDDVTDDEAVAGRDDLGAPPLPPARDDDSPLRRFASSHGPHHHYGSSASLPSHRQQGRKSVSSPGHSDGSAPRSLLAAAATAAPNKTQTRGERLLGGEAAVDDDMQALLRMTAVNRSLLRPLSPPAAPSPVRAAAASEVESTTTSGGGVLSGGAARFLRAPGGSQLQQGGRRTGGLLLTDDDDEEDDFWTRRGTGAAHLSPPI